MKKLVIHISIASCMLAFSHLAAESLFASNIKARLADADRDGVIEARDLCPDTVQGAAIDNDGCPAQTTKLLSVELNILFDSGKADIKPKFYSELTELATFLRKHPNSNVVIEGHTDSLGSAESNRVLSQKRASAIADVLIDSFRIAADRVKGVGYGETRPIATNDTAEGRSQNRRVVAEVFAKEKFAKQRWTIYSIEQSANNAYNRNN